MKKIISFAGSMALALLLFAACGGVGSSVPTAANAGASAPVSSPSGTSSGPVPMPVGAPDRAGALPVETRYGKAVVPVGVAGEADAMQDAALIALFERVYNNAVVSNDWLMNVVIQVDETDTLPSPLGEGAPGPAVQYARVTGVESMAALKTDLAYCFSDGLLETYIFPTYFEGETPKFMEQDGKLYQNINTGGAIQQSPDYQAATVTDKSAVAFTVNAPMHGPDNKVLEVYAYRVVQQQGYWVLDSFYFYDGEYFNAT